MRAAEEAWEAHGNSARFPISGLRVVYAKAGTLPAAIIIKDARAVIDHKLYWSAVGTEDEARYQ